MEQCLSVNKTIFKVIYRIQRRKISRCILYYKYFLKKDKIIKVKHEQRQTEIFVSREKKNIHSFIIRAFFPNCLRILNTNYFSESKSL